MSIKSYIAVQYDYCTMRSLLSIANRNVLSSETSILLYCLLAFERRLIILWLQKKRRRILRHLSSWRLFWSTVLSSFQHLWSLQESFCNARLSISWPVSEVTLKWHFVHEFHTTLTRDDVDFSCSCDDSLPLVNHSCSRSVWHVIEMTVE